MAFYSSQEWTKTVVDGKSVYLGLWGHSVSYYNSLNGPNLFLIGGQYDEAGPFSSASFIGKEGLFCDIEGRRCGGK